MLGDNLKDVFCSTVHKSQGSTYNHIFLDLKDILKTSQNKYRNASYLDDRPKLLYTAVSRASEKVYLIDWVLIHLLSNLIVIFYLSQRLFKRWDFLS